MLKETNSSYVLQYYSKLTEVDSAKYLKTITLPTEDALLGYICDLKQDKTFIRIKNIRSITDLELK